MPFANSSELSCNMHVSIMIGPLFVSGWNNPAIATSKAVIAAPGMTLEMRQWSLPGILACSYLSCKPMLWTSGVFRKSSRGDNHKRAHIVT